MREKIEERREKCQKRKIKEKREETREKREDKESRGEIGWGWGCVLLYESSEREPG